MLLYSGCTWLTLMPLLLSLSTGEVNFYRDTLSSDDITLKQLAQHLEAHGFHHSYLPLLLSYVHNKHKLQHEDRNLLKILTEKFDLEKLLRQPKLKTLNHYRTIPYDWIDRIIPERNVEAYYDLGVKLTYPEEKLNKDQSDIDFEDLPISFGTDRRIAEKSMDFRTKNMHDHVNVLHEGKRESMEDINIPEFTYKFDNAHFKDEHPFAVNPNDPRYYSNMPFSSARQHVAEMSLEDKEAIERRMMAKHMDNMHRIFNQKISKDIIAIDPLEEPERIGGHPPFIVPVKQEFNNDVYFIAVVAGCSAAAMFTVVLISLTWCRLIRGAKAAADIEYPAYGVTGPNKDVSPSGDQRLAQSAQMYHFQHQKQQIIAMENRASATRDPASLSDVESDEENEEGDYTVYECPGLASTGEMEVKNPMFQDDPSSVTPAQSNNKEEDHI